VPDLSTQIREYVDGVNEPVTIYDVGAVLERHSIANRRGGSSRHPRRLGVGVGAAVLASVVVVVALVALPSGIRRGHTAPRHGSGQAATAVLDEAAGTALAANSEAPRLGQILNLTDVFLVHGFVKGSDGQHFSYNVAGTGQWSLNPDGTGSEMITLGDPSFSSSADKATWIALGSLVLVPSHQITESLPLTPAQSQQQTAQNGLGAPPTSPTVLPYNEVAALPTDPGTLEQELVAKYENGHLDVGQTFDLAANLLEEGAGPAQRSALYKMVASLPGVTLDGPTVTDITDKQGTGVSVDVDGARRELVFDPTTSSVLEERNIVGPSWPTSLPFPQSANPSTPFAAGTQILAYTVFQDASVVPSST
jgi:hypothetical protein